MSHISFNSLDDSLLIFGRSGLKCEIWLFNHILILFNYLLISLQPWKDISPAAKDFIDKLLVVNVSERMSAVVALKHPWIISNAASSSLKNLQKSISHNWLKRTSTRSRSTKSAQSRRSNRSKGSSRSLRSDKSRDKRKLQDRELTALAKEMKKVCRPCGLWWGLRGDYTLLLSNFVLDVSFKQIY